MLTCALVLAAAAAPAADEAAAAREQFKKAYNSMRAGNVTLANKQAAGLANHPLYLYVRYAYLQPRLHRVGAGEVRDFLSAYEGSVMAERLRTAWLQHLGRKRSWDAYLDAYRPQDDAALECLHWQARQKTGNSEGLLVDARRLWLVGRSQPDECDPVFATLAASPEMTDELLIARLTLAMHENQSGLGRYLAGRIRDPELKRVAGKWYAMHHNPDRYLKDPALKADTPLTRAILAHGVRRLTRRNIDTALNRWQALSGTHAFTPAEAGVVQRDLALAANRHEHADRLRLLDGIPATAVDAVVDRARIVAALEERNWELLARWTSGAPSPDFNALRARYWHGRALEELGKTEAARLVFRELASERDYYGFRAADRLGVTYSMNDYPILVSEAERTAIMANPGVLRARELLAMDYRYMARREWHHELKKMTRRELEVAALQAHEWGWHDRAIITVGKAQAYDDLALRFPLLYQQEVEYYADKRKVGAELLYSIMRAESAFMFDARSPAGALGLMQLMPATAR
ncbi:MAG: transglycosylase SLT domain-containing protein, partial [Gammaproteobacteria bacterium]|nr:transglycosylase SLT domain-containing protein [Gammaproteobacteria bacterium]